MKTPLRIPFSLCRAALRGYLERVAPGFPKKSIGHGPKPLATKYRLSDDALGDAVRSAASAIGAAAPDWATRLPKVVLSLHRFHRGDDDEETHNHPWLRAASLILVNGYVETRDDGDGTFSREVRAGDVIVHRPDTFHRVDIPQGGETWTLFAHDGSGRRWGFRSATDGSFVPSDRFFESFRVTLDGRRMGVGVHSPFEWVPIRDLAEGDIVSIRDVVDGIDDLAKVEELDINTAGWNVTVCNQRGDRACLATAASAHRSVRRYFSVATGPVSP